MNTTRTSGFRVILAATCVLAGGSLAAAQVREDGRSPLEDRIDTLRAARGQDRPTQDQPSGEGEVPGLTPEGDYTFEALSEPMQVSVLVSFVAQQLGINVVVESGLSGSVVFNAPVTVSRDGLLPLLNSLLDQQGYGLVVNPINGWYEVVPSASLPVRPDGPFATTRIYETPGVRPSSLQQALNAQMGQRMPTRVSFVDELGVVIITDTIAKLDEVGTLIDTLMGRRSLLSFTRIELRHLSASAARTRALELVGQGGGDSLTSAIARAATGGQPAQPGGAPTSFNAPGFDSLPGRLIADASGNALLLRGLPEEEKMLREIIELIDVPNRLEPREFYTGGATLQIASFAQQRGMGSVQQFQSESTGALSGLNQFNNLNRLSGTPGGLSFNEPQGSSGPSILVDETRGRIIYYATGEQHEQMDKLIRQLDTEADLVVIKTYKLHHADSVEVADLILGLIDNQRPQGNSPFLPSNLGPTARGTRGQQQPQPDNPQVGEQQQAQAAAEGGVALSPSEDVFVLADESNNQVLVKAPIKQQREFETLIEKLDLRRPQVYIEAQIVAVTAGEDFQFAVETQLVNSDGLGGALQTVFGLSSAGTGFVDPRAPASGLGGITAALFKSEYTPVIINALQENTDARIISSPQLLVNDNEEASIVSLDQQPTTSRSQGVNSDTVSFQGYEDAGTDLSVTPSISEGGFLRLQYQVKLSSFTGSATTEGVPPPRQENTLASNVTVPSGMTVVLGGIKFDSKRKTIAKVPFIGDIPIVGELFKGRSRNNAVTTLYVFLTPKIMRDPNFDDLRLLTKNPRSDVALPPGLPPLDSAPIRIVDGRAEQG